MQAKQVLPDVALPVQLVQDAEMAEVGQPCGGRQAQRQELVQRQVVAAWLGQPVELFDKAAVQVGHARGTHLACALGCELNSAGTNPGQVPKLSAWRKSVCFPEDHRMCSAEVPAGVPNAVKWGSGHTALLQLHPIHSKPRKISAATALLDYSLLSFAVLSSLRCGEGH